MFGGGGACPRHTPSIIKAIPPSRFALLVVQATPGGKKCHQRRKTIDMRIRILTLITAGYNFHYLLSMASGSAFCFVVTFSLFSLSFANGDSLRLVQLVCELTDNVKIKLPISAKQIIMSMYICKPSYPINGVNDNVPSPMSQT